MLDKKDLISFLITRLALASSSVKTVVKQVSPFIRFLKENNLPLTSSSFEQFVYHLKKKGLTNNTINKYVWSISTYQSYLKNRGKITEDFIVEFKQFKRVIPTVHVLTSSEIQKLIDAPMKYTRDNFTTPSISLRTKTMIMFLAFTGCRFNEMASLKVKNLDLGLGKVTFVNTKNSEDRMVDILEPLLSALVPFVKGKNPNEFVFSSQRGTPLDETKVSIDLKARAKLVGINKRVYPHLFRHSLITELISRGVPITVVAMIAGHKNIEQTNKYTHLASDLARKALYNHPLLRPKIDPIEIIRGIKETIKSLNLDSDPRLRYSLKDQDGTRLELVVEKVDK